jgi:hypothetical protein
MLEAGVTDSLPAFGIGKIGKNENILPKNVKLGWKWFSVTNTLYYTRLGYIICNV